MKIIEIIHLLIRLSALANSFGDRHAARALLVLSQLLKAHSSKTITQLRTHLESSGNSLENDSVLSALGTDKMAQKKLVDQLDNYSTTSAPEARVKAANDLSNFVSLLRERIENGFSSHQDTIDGNNESDDTRENGYFDALVAAGVSRELLNAVITEMQADKSLSSDQLFDISRRFSGIRKKPRSHKEAIDRIRDKFEIEAQHKAKLDAIERLTERGNS